MSPEPSEVLQQARSLVERGQSWKARDVLAEHARTEADPEVLDLLGEVLHGMGDLPRAGAAWFAAGTKGPRADAAVGAWRDQTGDDFPTMWHSLPASVRSEPRPPRIEALRAKALEADPHLEVPASPLVPDVPAEEPADDEEGGVDAAQVVAWIVAAAFVACAVIGMVTVLGWMLPDA